MSQTNYTPISLYYSTTASAVPTAANLVPGELAINTNDGKLYYEDSSGVVQVLATKSTGSIGGSNTQVQFNNSGSLGGSSSFTWDGTTVTATKFAGALNGTVGATTASTGAFTTINASTSITNAGLTSGRVTFAGASGLLSDSAGLIYDGTNLTTTGTATATRFIPSGSTIATNGMYLPAANTLGFSTNSTERMRIDSSGNLLVGTTSATNNPFGSTSKLVVNHTGGFGQSVTDLDTSATDHYFISFNLGLASGNQKGYIYYNNATGTVLLNATSDARLKKNIVNAPSVLELVNQVKVRQYDWKDTGNTNIGFVAQELHEVIPRAVSVGQDNEDGSIKRAWGVDNGTLVPYLFKAIQEQQALIESLTTRLTALENK